MCGITGILTRHSDDTSIRSVQQMTDTLRHRGPDDSGIWLDREYGIGLGHRRLAILDLSPSGHQPMQSYSGRYVIVFNGEVYNHLSLRKQLAAGGALQRVWQGHSDTETLLACFETWGIKKSLQDFVGMFALAVWDRQERLLTLARDRMGEKPLYYGWCNGGSGSFIFGSELKALRQYPGFTNAIVRDVLPLYLRYSYIPAPYSIYQGIYKLEPGCMLTLISSDRYIEPAFAPHAPCKDTGWILERYWSLHDQVKKRESGIILDERDALSSLETALAESVRIQSRADVPLGAFLSGGIDSSLIAALMQGQATKPIKTFTIGFEEDGYSEAVYAKAVAEHLHTEHTELYLTATQAMEVIPQLPTMYDEPFADSSQIPTFLVAQMARQYVTVALSGDGGDELFGGYNRYFWGPRIWSKLSWLPWPVRRLMAKLITVLAPSQWDVLASLIGRGGMLVGDKAHKLAVRLEKVRDLDDLYLTLVSEWQDSDNVTLQAQKTEHLLTQRSEWPTLPSAEQRMMYLDALTYLPDDILCKVDRAAMGASLETRVPFLDHRVVELAWRLPLDMKIRNGQGKWILRQLLYRYVPKTLIERPKQGFGIPLAEWLRGPLKDWAEALLDEKRLQREGYFNPSPIRLRWQEHLTAKRNWEYSLWSILMFQAWLETQQEKN